MTAASARLLLVDDHEGNRLTLSALLEDEGFEVDTASSCEEAAAVLASAEPYAAVLLDMHLGDGLGVDLVEPVRARMPAAKVVLVTGVDAPLDEGGLAGADAFIAKGEDVDVLLERLESLLGPLDR